MKITLAAGPATTTAIRCQTFLLTKSRGASSGPAAEFSTTAASNNPALSTLVTAVKKAGLVDTLNNAENITVFAPTNDAFATLIGALGQETVLSCDVLPTVLAYHVTAGRHTSTSVLAHDRFRMLSGEWAAVEGTTIAGAPLNLGLINISASNGIVHVVDGVLIPPSILAALR